jgi:hypothetical protein
MIDDDETEEVEDTGGIGAEGDDSAETPPGAPSKDDDTPVGDTDQHSEVPSPPAQSS